MDQAKRKGRSPNYPQWLLSEAIEKVRQVFTEEHFHTASRDVIAKDMGYQSLNGASLTAIAALRHYNLLENEGSGLHVTEDAVSLIELPRGEAARDKALVRVALAPSLFSEMFREFGDTLPSEANLRHWLLKKGFMSKAADDVIRIYLENFELAGDAIRRYAGPDGTIDEDRPKPSTQTMQQHSNAATSKPAAPPAFQPPFGGVAKAYSWALSGDVRANLQIEGMPEDDDLEMLRDYVDITIKALKRKRTADARPSNSE
jgi:hypothetical protein